MSKHPRRAGEPHSFLGAAAAGRGSAGCVRPGVALQTGLPPRRDLRFLFPPFSWGLRTLPFSTFAAKPPANLGEDPRPVRPARRPGVPAEGPLPRSVVTAGSRGAEALPSLANPVHCGPSPLPQILPRRVGLLSTSPQEPAGDTVAYRAGTPWGLAPPCLVG